MRELEFLPGWYPQARKSRRMVALLSYLTIVVIAWFGLWMMLAERNIRVKQTDKELLEHQIAQQRSALKQLDVQLELKHQLQQQDEVMAKVGLHVEVSRMLAQLDSIMPKEMSLRDLSLDTIEQFHDSSLMAPTSDKDRPLDRRLNVRLTGVAPSDVDLANFLTKLTSVPIFEQVALIKADDGHEDGHLTREFQVTFSMNLNQPALATTASAAVGGGGS